MMEIKNKSKKMVYGFGVTDCTTSKNGEQILEYRLWKSMIRRCYSENRTGISRNYLDCAISDDFKYFSDFKNWCAGQKGFGIEGWQLDKDLLSKGGKLYSPETCCFIPQGLNVILIKQNNQRGNLPIGVCLNKKLNKYQANITHNGRCLHLGVFENQLDAFNAYKREKELILRNFAMKHEGIISDRAYKALLSYNVLISD